MLSRYKANLVKGTSLPLLASEVLLDFRAKIQKEVPED